MSVIIFEMMHRIYIRRKLRRLSDLTTNVLLHTISYTRKITEKINILPCVFIINYTILKRVKWIFKRTHYKNVVIIFKEFTHKRLLQYL